MDKKDIYKNIEIKRRELAKAIELYKLDLTNKEIIKLSKELDYLIALYNKTKNN